MKLVAITSSLMAYATYIAIKRVKNPPYLFDEEKGVFFEKSGISEEDIIDLEERVNYEIDNIYRNEHDGFPLDNSDGFKRFMGKWKSAEDYLSEPPSLHSPFSQKRQFVPYEQRAGRRFR